MVGGFIWDYSSLDLLERECVVYLLVLCLLRCIQTRYCQLLNAPGINWKELSLHPEAYNKGMRQRLIDILDSFELTQLIQEPTRHKAVLDLFCTN